MLYNMSNDGATTTCTATRCTAPATTERTHPNGDIDDLCEGHAREHDALAAQADTR